MKNKDDILKCLKNEAEHLEIPDNISPENMQRLIKQKSAQRAAEKPKTIKTYGKMLAMAACFCVVIGSILFIKQEINEPDAIAREDAIPEEMESIEIAEQVIEYPKVSYQAIYDSMSVQWAEQEAMLRGELPKDGEIAFYETSIGEPTTSDTVLEEAPAEESATAEKQMNAVEDLAAGSEFGSTNVQTVGVDEGDIVKNDGRYLYQKAVVEKEHERMNVIQIIDTKDGLQEVGCIEDVEGFREFYIWKDTLVVIKEKYLEEDTAAAKNRYVIEDMLYHSNLFHEISFYDIKDRSQPKEIKTFTLQGGYESSRIAEGYFYGFSKYYASPGDGAEDYAAYVPKIDGEYLSESRIYLPEDSDQTSYLVLVSIDLNNPAKFTDTTGIITGANLYYVSGEHIYVTDAKDLEQKEGWTANTTSILKFSYEDGKFALKAKGEVKGSLENGFSMDEYHDHMRVVSTVQEYERRQVTDDRTGETIGYHIVDLRKTNALYVLDEDLKQVGSIEGLAENEQIYSARFMGDTGYFVTFRQTDPLFTVDLSNPAKPEILSELKVSGFSEYLHIYGENRLLGIGMEADEETGVQQGMKLSMFDTSDKTNVQEISKLPLEDYYYSEALYNHRAVMISTGKNIFGFEAEGSGRSEYRRDYLVYTYENDKFVQKLKISTKTENGGYYTTRGTFIGDIFYLLSENGTVRSYDLNTGAQLESLEP